MTDGSVYSANGSCKVRVLIVDDHEPLRKLLRRAFEKTDRYSVVAEAVDGGDAVEKAAQYRPDLVMLDLQMRPLDGFHALPRLRRLLPGSPVVVFTGADESTDQQALLDDGATSIIGKGTPLAVVFAELDRLLAAPPAAPPG